MMILLYVCIFLYVGYACLILLYRIGWHKQKEGTYASGFVPQTKVSIIIPARNEAENIAACLRSILENDYPEALMEIIVTDDFSTDHTAEIATGLLGKRGRVLALKDYLPPGQKINSFKKKALAIAIEQAQGDLIISTDADCIVPQQWIKNLVYLRESKNAKFIAGPVIFHRRQEKPVLFYFQLLDFMTMQGITAAAAALRLGNMCNGANLAFERAVFFEVGGYEGIDHIASGDDMLLMRKIQKAYPEAVYYLKSKAAIVTTAAQSSWAGFLNQRIRWASKADQYDDKKLTWILGLVYLFNLSLLVLFMAGCRNIFLLQCWLIIMIAKIFVELIFLFPVARFYNQTKALIFFPILQPVHILYIIAAGFLGKFGTYRWKNRKVV